VDEKDSWTVELQKPQAQQGILDRQKDQRNEDCTYAAEILWKGKPAHEEDQENAGRDPRKVQDDKTQRQQER